MARVAIVPLGGLNGSLVSALGARLGESLPLDVELVTRGPDPASAYDPARGQFHSTELLEMQATSLPVEGGDRLLGVIDRDLFVPILTFVFGEAQLRGTAAVLSLTRLSPSFYGMPPDPEVLLDRAEKEAIHEVGHTFGLVHCPEVRCVMRASTSAEEVDLKPSRFCRSCSNAMGLAMLPEHR